MTATKTPWEIAHPPGGMAPLFADVPFSNQGTTWDELWQKKITPWDVGNDRGPSFALNELLTNEAKLFGASDGSRRKTALVPACGQGYDALLLSSWGYDVLGLDISKTSIDLARELEKSVEQGTAAEQDMYRLQVGVKEKGKITWIVGDFFSDEFLRQTGGVNEFDLLFDFTFYCAIPVAERPRWAKRMTELLAEDGKLVCLEFPRLKPVSTGGPPYAATSEMYLANLGHPGEQVESGRDELLTKGALERVSWTKPTKTFKLGTAEDGSVTDMISVWIHDGGSASRL